MLTTQEYIRELFKYEKILDKPCHKWSSTELMGFYFWLAENNKEYEKATDSHKNTQGDNKR